MSSSPSSPSRPPGGVGGDSPPARPSPVRRFASDVCVVSRQNSITFRRDDGSSCDRSLSGHTSEVLRGMLEVVDSRPSGHHAVAHTETSSLVSLVSSLDLSHDSNNSNNSSSKESEFAGDDDMPNHWQAAGSLFPRTETSAKDKEKNPPSDQDRRASLSRKSSLCRKDNGQVYRALQKLVRQVRVDGRDSQDQDNNASFDSDGTGFWSQLCKSPALGYNRDSDESSGGSNKMWDKMESNLSTAHSLRTECRPLTLQKRMELRRKLYIRRCVKAMAGFLVLAALSAVGIKIVVTDHQRFEWLPNGRWIAGLFSDGVDAAGKGPGRLRHGALAKGQGEDAVPVPWLPREEQDKDFEEDVVPPWERTLRAREKRVRDHEKRVRLWLTARERREHEAVARHQRSEKLQEDKG